LGEYREFEVLGRDDSFSGRDLPVDIQLGVIVADPAFAGLVIKGIAFIKYCRGLTEYGEAVGEATGDEQLALVFVGQFYADVLSICRGTPAKIDGYVQYPAPEDADELSLGMRIKLVVQATDDAVPGKGLVILDEMAGDLLLVEGLFVIRFEKISAFVLIYCRFEDQ
jgi:hypothetical protein